jgi:hypothetical protein
MNEYVVKKDVIIKGTKKNTETVKEEIDNYDYGFDFSTVDEVSKKYTTF